MACLFLRQKQLPPSLQMPAAVRHTGFDLFRQSLRSCGVYLIDSEYLR